MITRLKPRPRMDNLQNHKRGGRKRLARTIYLGVVIGLVGSLVMAIIGPMFFLSADGLVLLNKQVVATQYSSQIVKNHVRPGQTVYPGMTLLSVRSQDMLKAISDLHGREADLAARVAQINARLLEIKALAPIAEERLQLSNKRLSSVKKLSARKLSTHLTDSEAHREAFEARREVATFGAQKDALATELVTLETSLAEVRKNLEAMRIAYGDGRVIAINGGIVGANVPSEGEVVRAGEPLMEILTGDPYVLAYVPTGRFYSINDGQEVLISDGANAARAHIERIEAVADSLPKEFQNNFRGSERLQLVRISFAEPSPFPFRSQVTVSKRYGPTHLISALRRVSGQRAQYSSLPEDTRYVGDIEVDTTIHTGSIGTVSPEE